MFNKIRMIFQFVWHEWNRHIQVEAIIGGKPVQIDCGILDLVLWVNQLPDVKTHTCCKGGAGSCSPDAMIGFQTDNMESIEKLKRFITVPARYESFDKKNPTEPQIHFVRMSAKDLKRLNREKFPKKWSSRSTPNNSD